MHASTQPAVGQLVRVRERIWAVEDIRPSSLPADALRGEGGAGPQHFIHLQSVEDDGAGDELSVVWELEPGAEIFEGGTLPDPERGFDDPLYLEAFLDAVRWGAIASADVQHLNAPFRAGIRIEDYQLEPVARALRMPRVNLLIADDVGLGKTIEAGLVLQELLLRNRARTAIVVCPAGLQAQWRDEMRDKFGLEFRIVNSESISTLRRERGPRVNPWLHYPRLITSIDFLKQDRILRSFSDAVSGSRGSDWRRPYDVLILDEAHNVAPAGKNRPVDSLRTKAIQHIARHFEHRLFLTATPHNGYVESYKALLELLDDQRFARTSELDKKQAEQVVVRRLKREIPEDDLGRRRFPERVLEAVEVDWTPTEHEAHQRLREYGELRIERAKGDTGAEFAVGFVLTLLKKRLFSCPAAFQTTLEQHLHTLGRGTGRDLRSLKKAVADLEDDYDNDEEWEDDSADAISSASHGLAKLTDAEREHVEWLRDWAGRAANQADSKAKALISWIQENLLTGGSWNDERVIIFTEYRATQNWLRERLNTVLPRGDSDRGKRILQLYGGMHLDDREHVKAAFLAPPDRHPVRILLATDAASEGIDLQKNCSELFHYEIPWNPNRLEQRNGRIDRHGQKKPKVFVRHFVSRGFEARAQAGLAQCKSLDDDLDLLYRIAKKVEQIREDLGSAGQVLSSTVESAMLGRSIDLERVDEGRAEVARRQTRFERDLRAIVARLREDLRESRETLHLSAANLKRVVEIGLELSGHSQLVEEAVGDATTYRVPELKPAWRAATSGLRDPLGKPDDPLRPVVFEADTPAVRAIEDDVVRLHLGSRLVRMCLELLRAEIWAPDTERKLSRVTAVAVPSNQLEHPVLLGLARLVLLGARGERLHEELIRTGGTLRENRFRRLNVSETDAAFAALESSHHRRVAPDTQTTLRSSWPTHRGSLEQALEARAKERSESLAKRLVEHRDDELMRMKEVLNHLEREIREELPKVGETDTFKWTKEEQKQFDRDREALRLRLEQIPAELERERARIHARYETIQPRTFPVAVLWLIPEHLDR